MEIATYGVGLFTPTILRSIEISERTRGLAARDFALAEGSVIIDLFLPIGFLLRVWTIPRFGRIRMQAIGVFEMAVTQRPGVTKHADHFIASGQQMHAFSVLLCR